MRFVTDVDVGHAVETYLTSAGYDVKSILDVDITLPDGDILTIAETEQRIAVTMDKDFGELVFRSGRAHAGILLLRLEDATGPEKAEVVRAILTQHADKIAGHFCVFQNGRLRIR